MDRRSAARVLADAAKPDLTLVYLPHLDYDPQRFGPSGMRHGEVREGTRRRVRAAARRGARRSARRCGSSASTATATCRGRCTRTARCAKPGLLDVRNGPFGEQLDLYGSRAFAVCDHQLAHVYVRDAERRAARARRCSRRCPAWRRVLAGEERAAIDLDHARTGEIDPARGAGRVVRVSVLARRPRSRPTTPARSRSTASRASTRASCSSIRSCGSRSCTRRGGCSRRSSASA